MTPGEARAVRTLHKLKATPGVRLETPAHAVPSGDEPLRVLEFVPPGSTRAAEDTASPAILFLHGGGWVLGGAGAW